MEYIFLILSFYALIKGADIFVGGASNIAKKFKVPAIIIGLTIVAMGTSAPEAAISITSALAGKNDMSIGNVVGSNIFNILGVLGVASILSTIIVPKESLKRDLPVLVGVSFLLVLMVLNGNLSRVEGILLFLICIAYILKLIKAAKQNSTEVAEDEEAKEEISIIKSIILSLIGIVLIVVGGDLVVENATKIATSLGMSEALVGLTIVSIGTSLPEFVTSIVAVKKGEVDLAVGNVVGSNLFNILLVLGLSSAISPMPVIMSSIVDLIIVLSVTVLLFLFVRKSEKLVKYQGVIFVLMYVLYMAYIIMR